VELLRFPFIRDIVPTGWLLGAWHF